MDCFEFGVPFAMETMWISCHKIALCSLSDYGSVLIPWPVQSATTTKTTSNEDTRSWACSDMKPAVLEIWFLAPLPKLKPTLPQFNRRCFLACPLLFWTPRDPPLILYRKASIMRPLLNLIQVRKHREHPSYFPLWKLPTAQVSFIGWSLVNFHWFPIWLFWAHTTRCLVRCRESSPIFKQLEH